MSLENNLERIAIALEALVASKAGANVTRAPTATEVTQAQVKADARVEAKMKVPAPAPAEVPAPAPAEVPAPAPAEVPAPAGLVVASPEECNTLLVAEYNRLGGNPEVMQHILGLMENQFGVRSVNDLTKEQYGPLITAVRGM
jgi:hypothetical protein